MVGNNIIINNNTKIGMKTYPITGICWWNSRYIIRIYSAYSNNIHIPINNMTIILITLVPTLFYIDHHNLAEKIVTFFKIKWYF